MEKYIKTSLFALAFAFLFLGNHGSALARGAILGVEVSPDLNRVIVKKKGRLGPYNAFVIGSPNRLVIDFRSARLGRTPRRMRIGRPALREIRLGIRGSGARVVLDFGSAQTPGHNIDVRHDEVVISLAREPRASRNLDPEPPTRPSGGSSFSQRAPVAQVTPENERSSLFETKADRKPLSERLSSTMRRISRGSAREKELSALEHDGRDTKPKPQPERVELLNRSPNFRVTQAGAYDGAVFVELSGKKNPQRLYRLVLEFDPSVPSVGNISIADARGKIASFVASRAKGERRAAPKEHLDGQPEPVESEVGHVEETDEAPAPPVEKRTFGWGRKERNRGGNVAAQSNDAIKGDLRRTIRNPVRRDNPTSGGSSASSRENGYEPRIFKPGANPYSLDNLKVTTKGPGASDG
jgi:hypothetical protein